MAKKIVFFVFVASLLSVVIADTLVLQAYIRDFTPQTNPDFESFGGGVQTGIVESTLGADGTPVLRLPPQQVTSAASFYQWWHDVPGVNIPLTRFITLSNVGNADPNIFSYDNQNFFPIDNDGFGNTPGQAHNFHFTMHIHTAFTYHGGEIFNFRGDDDVWLFVNEKLVVDIGGVHGPADGSVNLDSVAASIGISVGNDYDFDLFFCERHTVGSSFKMDTTLKFQPPPTTGTTKSPTTGTTKNPTTGTTGTTGKKCDEDGTYRTQSEGDWGDKCSEGFTVGCYRDTHFAQCFPDGLTVGCAPIPQRFSGGYNIHFDGFEDIENYLPQLGRPDSLDRNYLNPSNPPPISTSSGNFGGQVTALALSLGFEDCDKDFHSDCGRLGDLFVCDNRCERCKRNDGQCNRNSQIHCEFVREEENEDIYDLDGRNNKNQNSDDGKPKYANCEAFYGWQVQDIFSAASDALGQCNSCLKPSRNNNNCVRNSQCKKSEALRNNQNCNRNSNCKKNKNCCCCVDQSPDPSCDPVVLNNCVTLINQAFIFGKHLSDVDSGNLFREDGCPGGELDK